MSGQQHQPVASDRSTTITGITPDWRQQIGYHAGDTSIANRGCRYCGDNVWHSGTCPRIKRIDYYPDGTIKSVELHRV